MLATLTLLLLTIGLEFINLVSFDMKQMKFKKKWMYNMIIIKENYTVA